MTRSIVILLVQWNWRLFFSKNVDVCSMWWQHFHFHSFLFWKVKIDLMTFMITEKNRKTQEHSAKYKKKVRLSASQLVLFLQRIPFLHPPIYYVIKCWIILVKPAHQLFSSFFSNLCIRENQKQRITWSFRIINNFLMIPYIDDLILRQPFIITTCKEIRLVVKYSSHNMGFFPLCCIHVAFVYKFHLKFGRCVNELYLFLVYFSLLQLQFTFCRFIRCIDVVL